MENKDDKDVCLSVRLSPAACLLACLLVRVNVRARFTKNQYDT